MLATIAAIAATAALLAPLSAHAALSRTDLLDTASASGYGTGSYVTGSFTPPDNSLLVAVIVMEMALDNASTPTISGGGLSWTERVSDRGQAEEDQIYIYTAPVTTGASMTLTLDHGAGNVYKYMPMVVAFTGYDTSSPTGATANDNDATGGSPFNLTLSSAPAASSVVVAAALADNAGGFITTGSDFTEVYFTEDDLEWQLQVRGNSTSQTASWQTLSAAFGVTGVAVEIKEGAAAGTSALSKPPNNLGLVGYWSFNEGTSTVATDFSGNRLHGALIDFDSPTWVSGKRGSALNFDGTNSFVEVTDTTNSPLDFTSAFTLSTWVKPRTIPGDAQYETFISKGGASSPYYLEYSGSSGSYFDCGFGGGTEHAATGYPVALNQWTHVTCTFDNAANTVAIYINGVSVYSVSTETGNPTANNAELIIGAIYDGAPIQVVDAFLDEVRIYNRAIGATEAAALARAGAARLTSNSKTLTQGSSLENGLVGLWTFDGADTQTTITDLSGSNNHGYFNGGATSSAKVIGKLGQAFTFDGINDNVRVPQSATLEPASTISFGAWVKPRAAGSDPTVFGTLDADSGYGILFDDTFHGCTANAIGAYISQGGDRCISYTSTVLNTWHHVMATYDGETFLLYVNGAQVASDTGPSGAISYQAGGDPLCIADQTDGTTCESGNNFTGDIDDARIYNRALTASEVKQLYNLGRAKIVQ